ncbi:hypothetical protein EJ110_NYTH59856 [Nymphaea thermarum]|nr:hypothetical protein EJ110_NYTH59856 [Nymphaea thermarum]
MYDHKKRVLHTYQIKHSIYSLKQGDLSVASFFAALKTKWEELDYHVNDDWHCGSDHALYWDKEWMDRTFIFLGGLRDEFESIRSQILNCDEIPGIEEVYARVKSEEQRRQVMHIDSSHGSSPSVFVSHASRTGQCPVRRCSHCNKLGHSVDFCWDIHPEKILVRGRPPSSRRGSFVLDSSQEYKVSHSVTETVRGDSDSLVQGNSVDDQSTARDHLFGQVYIRKKTDVVEDVDVTNPNPSHHEGEIVAVCRWSFCPPPPLVFSALPPLPLLFYRFDAIGDLAPPSGDLLPPSEILRRRRRGCYLRRRRREHRRRSLLSPFNAVFLQLLHRVLFCSRDSVLMADFMIPKVCDVPDTGSNTKGENLPVHVTSIRLNKDNYLSWSAALEIGITSRGRLQYITGEKPAPAKNDPQWSTWTLEDSQVKVWIISSVSADIQPLILRKSTAYEMWTILARMYGRKKRVLHTYQIKRSIYALRQGDSSVASFYAALKTKWEELDYLTNDDWKDAFDHALYWEKEWMDRTFIFLGGLRDEYESIRSQLLNCDEIPGIEEGQGSGPLASAPIAINWAILWISLGTFIRTSVLFVVVLPPLDGLLLCPSLARLHPPLLPNRSFPQNK